MLKIMAEFVFMFVKMEPLVTMILGHVSVIAYLLQTDLPIQQLMSV